MKFKRIVAIMILLSLIMPFNPVMASAATVKLNYSKTEIIKGNYLTLKLIGAKSKVTWSSSNLSLASVSSKGKVTTLDLGNVTIYAISGNKKYSCKLSIVPKPYLDYMTDYELDVATSQQYYLDNFSSKDIIKPATVKKPVYKLHKEDLEKIIGKMLRCGFSSSASLYTPIGKEYVHFCDSWVSEYELKNFYRISVFKDFVDNTLTLSRAGDITDFGDVSNNTPGDIYTNNNIQFMYLDQFVYGDDYLTVDMFYFNRADLVKAGFIE